MTRKPWTADELCRLPKGWRYEIDDGELVIMRPAGRQHNRVVTRVTVLLEVFARENRLGEVLTGETGVYVRRTPRETLRGVDVAFWSAERVKHLSGARGFLDVMPDLAVEVDDPSEPDLARKVAQYLAAGVRAVWVADPEAETLNRHAPNEPSRTWSRPDDIIEEPVVPGFTCHLRDLFEQEGTARAHRPAGRRRCHRGGILTGSLCPLRHSFP